MTLSEYLDSVNATPRERELSKCVAQLVNNLNGTGFDSLKPLSASAASELAYFGELVVFGMTVEQAIEEVKA